MLIVLSIVLWRSLLDRNRFQRKSSFWTQTILDTWQGWTGEGKIVVHRAPSCQRWSWNDFLHTFSIQTETADHILDAIKFNLFALSRGNSRLFMGILGAFWGISGTFSVRVGEVFLPVWIRWAHQLRNSERDTITNAIHAVLSPVKEQQDRCFTLSKYVKKSHQYGFLIGNASCHDYKKWMGTP